MVLWQLWALWWLHAHLRGSVTLEPFLPVLQRWPEQFWHNTSPSLMTRYFAIQACTAQLGPVSPKKKKKGGRPAGSTAWASSSSTESTWTTLISTVNLLKLWGEGNEIIPTLPKDQKQKTKHFHTRSSLVPRFLTSWLFNNLVLHVLLNHYFHDLLLKFFITAQI